MYAGRIENLNTSSPRLLEAADKYALSELKEVCEVGKMIQVIVETEHQEPSIYFRTPFVLLSMLTPVWSAWC